MKFLDVEGGHVPQYPIAGDATAGLYKTRAIKHSINDW